MIRISNLRYAILKLLHTLKQTPISDEAKHWRDLFGGTPNALFSFFKQFTHSIVTENFKR